jgi:hypothetical protein
LFAAVRVMYVGEEKGNGTEVSLKPRAWLGLVGERGEDRKEGTRGGIGPCPPYSLRSRSRVVLICNDASDGLLLELKVGETTSDSRAPRRFPSMTCRCQQSSNGFSAYGCTYVQPLLRVGQDNLCPSAERRRRVRVIALVAATAVTAEPSLGLHLFAGVCVARELVA